MNWNSILRAWRGWWRERSGWRACFRLRLLFNRGVDLWFRCFTCVMHCADLRAHEYWFRKKQYVLFGADLHGGLPLCGSIIHCWSTSRIWVESWSECLKIKENVTPRNVRYFIVVRNVGFQEITRRNWICRCIRPTQPTPFCAFVYSATKRIETKTDKIPRLLMLGSK